MRYSQVLVALMALVVVTMAGRGKRASRCIMSYSSCSADGTTNITFSDNPNNTQATCNKEGLTMVTCVVNKTINKRKCIINLSSNITPCGEGSATFNVTKALTTDEQGPNCATKFQTSVKEMSCLTDMSLNLKGKMKAEKLMKKKNKQSNKQKKAKKNGKQTKKERREKKRNQAATGKK